MIDYDARERGLKSKRDGDKFESRIEIECRVMQYNLIKIFTGCEVQRIRRQNKITLKKNPFDYIIQNPNGRCAFFDAKSRQGDRMNRSAFFNKKSTENQLKVLALSEQFGTKSGFIVWFRGVDKICFLPASKVWKMKVRSSLGFDDGIDLGTFETMKLERMWDDFE